MKLESKYNFLFFLTSIYLLLSLLIHVVTFFQIDMPWIDTSSWFLQLGVFLIWIPILNISIKKLNKAQKKEPYWRLFFKNIPKWMILISVIVTIYAVFNFYYTSAAFRERGFTQTVGKEILLEKNGEVEKSLSQDEQEKQKAYPIRSFSGHWIFFYTIAWLVLFRIRRLYKTKDGYDFSLT
jgi:hypothetical protein